jgi:hypothetical protein
MDSLVHCIYASSCGAEFDDQALRALLQQAREANEAAGVTGILLHSRGSFFQVLEGRPAAVETVFDRIYADPRHRAIGVLIFEPIAQRAFAHWPMGYAELSDAEAAALTGNSGDAFAQPFGPARLDEAGARRLLDEFASGRWRTRLMHDVQVRARSA